jgi:ABC-2 type transport system ATP-binding protein
MSVIRIEGLTKRFGAVLAVDNLNFVVAQGTVTGFLGPNGAGKTTTLRTLLGLITPTTGRATIDGRPYRELADPIRHVGALLDASGFHPGRSARNHLRVVATAAGLPAARADQVLAQVGLADVAGRRVGTFSLGMRQRLGLATALLGDPQVLVLDEPANGLDPEGVHWLRGLLRHLADQGRTVLVSSHVLAEIAQTVDQVVIIAAGRLVTQSTLAALTDQAKGAVRVRSADPQALRDLLVRQGVSVELTASDELVASGVSSEQIGRVAAGANIAIYEMRSESANLEKAFLQLTGPQGGTS